MADSTRATFFTILASGWTAAVVFFVTAAPQAADNPLEEYLQSKRHAASVQRIGGKAAVFAGQLDDWVSALFHGRALAVTVAVLTVLVALVYRAAARRPPPTTS
jgi:hypothetical protein